MNFTDPIYPKMLLRLIVAAVLGGLVGLERAEKKHDAGLRTHLLVCLGSASVMVMSEILFAKFNGSGFDITRMGAQVVSGIGFLGAGCIIANGNKVKGLTTAAGLWATSCVGLLVGLGYYAVAVTVVALMLLAMLGLQPIADRLHAKSVDISIRFLLSDSSHIEELMRVLKSFEMDIQSAQVEEQQNGLSMLVLEATGNRRLDQNAFLQAVGSLDGVKEISFI